MTEEQGEQAAAIIDAVLRSVRAQTIEECAARCDAASGTPEATVMARSLAHAIRAMLPAARVQWELAQ